jgi:hypothetical protein
MKRHMTLSKHSMAMVALTDLIDGLDLMEE